MVDRLGHCAAPPARPGSGSSTPPPSRRADGAGSNDERPAVPRRRRSPRSALLPGSSEAQVVPELGPEPDRPGAQPLHGLNPMAGTDLDPILRNLGITTLIVTGVSVERGHHQPGHGRREPRVPGGAAPDAVCGIPAEYADAVIDNTLALLATLTTVDALVSAWATHPEAPL